MSPWRESSFGTFCATGARAATGPTGKGFSGTAAASTTAATLRHASKHVIQIISLTGYCLACVTTQKSETLCTVMSARNPMVRNVPELLLEIGDSRRRLGKDVRHGPPVRIMGSIGFGPLSRQDLKVAS